MKNWRRVFDMEQEPAGVPATPPVFITGIMRSGTSYLLAKMCEHPQLIQIGTELNDVWTSIGGAPCKGNCAYRDESDFDVKYAHQMAAYFSNYLRRAPLPHRTLMRVRRKLRGDGGRIWYDWDKVQPLNKSPHLMNKIRYVNALFPESKWICIVRSIYGNAASMKVFMERRLKDYNLRLFYPTRDEQACWYSVTGDEPDPTGEQYVSGLEEFWTIPRMWSRLNRVMLHDIKHLPDDMVKVISYQDLVLNQHDTLMSVFRFLGVDKDYPEISDGIASHAMHIINTTSKGNPMDKWKQTLTREEIDLIDRYTETEEYQNIQAEVDLLVNSQKYQER